MMTKEQYLKAVKRKLYLPKKIKNTILKDLEETFVSAEECGEKTEDVIVRIGTPAEFIRDVMENAELTDKQYKYIRHMKAVRPAIIFFIAAAISVTLHFLIKHLYMMMNGVIGYADSSTEIFVTGGAAEIMLFIGYGLLWIIPSALIIYFYYLKKQINS